MNIYLKAAVTLLAGMFAMGASAAAVTCVENKTTGKFEEKAAPNKQTGECDAQATLNLLVSLADVERSTVGEGTKVVGGSVVTNTPNLAEAVAAAMVKIRQEDSERQAAAVRAVVAAATQKGATEAAAPGTAVAGLPRRTSIKEGERFDLALAEFAKENGWIFKWYPKRSWKAIGDIDLRQYKDAQAAIEDIISGLRQEGKPVQIRTSEGNHVMEVLSTEVTND